MDHDPDAEFFRSVLAASEDCIKVLDLDGRLVFMSEGGQRVMEVDDFSAIRGRLWPDFWQGDGHIKAKAAVAAAKAGGSARFQGYADTLAGTPRWWDVQVKPIVGPDGRPEKLLSISRDITAIRVAEDALRQSESRYRNMVELHPQTTWTAAPDGQLDHVNPRWFEWTGTSGLGDSWANGLHVDDRERTFAAWARSVASGEPYDIEHRVKMLDGEYRWMHSRAYPHRDEQRRIVKWYGTTDDVHERRIVELQLQHSEARFKAALDAIGILWTNDADGRMAGEQPGWASLTGQSHEAYQGFGWTDAVHPDDAGPTVDAWNEAVAARRVFAHEHRVRRRDGEWSNFIIRAVPVLDDKGSVREWVGVHTDITEQRASEARLRELNETLETRVAERTRERDRAWKYSLDLQLVVGSDGTIRAANDAWTAVLGWRPDEIAGHHHLFFSHPEDVRTSDDALTVASRTKLSAYEHRVLHKDGTYRWISWVAVAEGDLIYASGRHITAEKEAATALAAIEEQLRQSQKMEAVGQLTGGIAHDFNNLLIGITGSLELLQRRVAQGRVGEIDRYVNAAQGAATRAAALTHRVLAFSRRQTLDAKPTDVNRLVSGMADLIRRTVGPSIEIEVVGAIGLWSTLVDQNQLESALLNLCINARDAMPDGGRLTLETANKWLDERAARSRDLPCGQFISLCVTDTGTGMTPAVIERAFDPFFTTKPIGTGTGLGLSMVYGFARQSGGQVRIYSEVGKGTTMCIYLPRHHGSAAAEEAYESEEAPRAEQGETVLVVDDEPTIRMLVTEVLEELGYTALEAGDGSTGLKIVQSTARIDLLITDVGLPGGMNGRQLADGARVVRPDLKVLFITGYAENAVMGNGHLDPGMQVLTKPFTMDSLGARIKQLIGPT